MKTIVVGSLFGSMLVMAVACGAADVSYAPCNPDGPFPDPGCIAQFAADAGADASDGSGGSSNARAACAGRCMPRADANNGGAWIDPPISVWIGPKDLMPSCCPGSPGCNEPTSANVPTKRFRVFDQIIAPPAECDACECGASEGTCTGLPEKIEIRAGMCGQNGAASLSFSGPPGWDGSCSNEGGLAAGAMCNGAPCAQSVWSPPLPGPTTESCTPKSATPTATIKKADWARGALACEGNLRNEDCVDGEPFCVEDPGLPWVQCVYRKGTEEPCPDNYNQGRYEMYPEDAVDDRGCEACSCGDPVGSGCLGKVPLFSDGACQVELTKLLVSSMVDGCQNMSPPGVALGSKEFTGLAYMPGSCAATGGAPKGIAKGDAMRVMTFCCGPFFNIPK